MADWSQLPKDLLLLISQHLEICFDVTHFRSVCSSWRSSVPPRPSLLLERFPSITPFRLYKTIVVLVRLPENYNQAAPACCLVKIVEHENKELYLSNQHSNYMTNHSKVLLDFMNCQVVELCRKYMLFYESTYDHPPGPVLRDHITKAALMWSSTEKNDHLLLYHRFEELGMLRSRDMQWTILEDRHQSYEDIISFNGEFYALDEEGRTTVVDPSSNVVSFLAQPGSREGTKFLVESGGQLLLVESFSIPKDLRNMRQGWHSSTDKAWFKVYKLNEAGQKWDYIKSLGDRVLFLGLFGSFSASASEFSWSKANYIFFSTVHFDWNDENSRDFDVNNMCVFNYENGSVKSVKDCPGFLKLFWPFIQEKEKWFWPPPEWVTSSTFQLSTLPLKHC